MDVDEWAQLHRPEIILCLCVPGTLDVHVGCARRIRECGAMRRTGGAHESVQSRERREISLVCSTVLRRDLEAESERGGARVSIQYEYSPGFGGQRC